MKLPAAALLLAMAAVLAGAAAVPPPTPPSPAPAPPAPVALPAPAANDANAPGPSPYAPASDYTSQMLDPPLVGEYDPATAPPPAYASPPGDPGGLRQCVGADGVPIFTDRRCEDLGASDYRPPPRVFGASPAGPLRVRSCARNQDDLLAGVRAALESHDANRLADYYHWTGIGNAEGYRLMERLDSFSSRPVVDVQLVRSADRDPDPYADLYFDEPAPLPPAPEFTEDGEPIEAPPPPRRRPRLASMLRVDQMRGDDDAAATITYFQLLTNAGCWWMRF